MPQSLLLLIATVPQKAHTARAVNVSAHLAVHQSNKLWAELSEGLVDPRSYLADLPLAGVGILHAKKAGATAVQQLLHDIVRPGHTTIVFAREGEQQL